MLLHRQNIDVLLNCFNLLLHLAEVTLGLPLQPLKVLLVLLHQVDLEQVVVFKVDNVSQQRGLVEVDEQVIILVGVFEIDLQVFAFVVGSVITVLGLALMERSALVRVLLSS